MRKALLLARLVLPTALKSARIGPEPGSTHSALISTGSTRLAFDGYHPSLGRSFPTEIPMPALTEASGDDGNARDKGLSNGTTR